MRRLTVTAGLTVLLVLLVGCATLTPEQRTGRREAQAFLGTAAARFGVRPVALRIYESPNYDGLYHAGVVTISPYMLTAYHRDALLAHEFGHFLLNHDAPLGGDLTHQIATQRVRELEASVTAVSVLRRVHGWNEQQAVERVYWLLYSMHANPANRTPGGVRYTAVGIDVHVPCEEAAQLLRRFPASRSWVAGMECSPDEWDSSRDAGAGKR